MVIFSIKLKHQRIKWCFLCIFSVNQLNRFVFSFRRNSLFQIIPFVPLILKKNYLSAPDPLQTYRYLLIPFPFQCQMGHLMCAACFTHLLADGRYVGHLIKYVWDLNDITYVSPCSDSAIKRPPVPTVAWKSPRARLPAIWPLRRQSLNCPTNVSSATENSQANPWSDTRCRSARSDPQIANTYASDAHGMDPCMKVSVDLDYAFRNNL